MHQLPEVFQHLGSPSQVKTFTDDKIYSMYSTHENDLPDSTYDLTDLTYKQETAESNLELLSPTLADEELGDWKLNEVFQNIIGMDVNADEVMGEDSVSDYLQLMETDGKDLLAEAFGSIVDSPPTSPGLYTPEVSDAAYFPDFNSELTQLVPVTVSEIQPCAEPSVSAPASPAAQHKDTSSFAMPKRVSTKGKSKLSKTRSDKLVVVKSHETKKEAIRRVKNNVASRDFRSRKRYKLEDLLAREVELKEENQQMKLDVLMVEEVVQLLKDGLINSARKCLH